MGTPNSKQFNHNKVTHQKGATDERYSEIRRRIKLRTAMKKIL
jgi:hypothetical protein